MAYQPENRDRPSRGPFGGRLSPESSEEYPLFRNEPDAEPYEEFARWIDDQLLKLEARWSRISVRRAPVNHLKLRELGLRIRKT